ncbi:site-specific integrase [Haloarcula sp. Atlit-7R]|uniref:tyrosine-type recombinase/integrase n=1 Tax=Haloarcula sp. Atlit-7R TaxID=2282125 RepID=UPI000EF14F25|nr:tyrosine-type recombinase/integrase [Haloarcula sp. Atlit-7R]RLM96983.1 integrase [Haloarcula sp. Atlit-7R]
MSDHIVDLLADIEDPDTIEKLLELSDSVDFTSDQTEPSNPSTLHELYERYLSRRHDRSPATRSQYRRTIPSFIKFAEDRDIKMPAGISTELVDAYIDDLQREYDADATILTYTTNVRGWLCWLNKRGQCPDDVYTILDKDELGLSPRARDEAIPADEAISILEQLDRQRCGSFKHALLELLWNSGIRIGGAHSLDVRDFDPTNREIRLRHRPKKGTRLKNGNDNENAAGDGERNVTLSTSAVEAIEHYIDCSRPSVTDDFDREPLFATQYGRATRSTLRRRVYEATSCRWGNDSDNGACDENCDPDSNVCTYSYYPHAIRRGSIVHHLSGGLRPSIASERFDVSIQTLRKHYDPRTKRRRKEDRSEAVRNAWNK